MHEALKNQGGIKWKTVFVLFQESLVGHSPLFSISSVTRLCCETRVFVVFQTLNLIMINTKTYRESFTEVLYFVYSESWEYVHSGVSQKKYEALKITESSLDILETPTK